MLKLASETELIDRARQGERAAVEALIERHQDAIYSIAMTFTRDPHRAEDLAQEAWIRILRGLSGFRGEARFTTWMYRVVMNTFLNAPRPPEVELVDWEGAGRGPCLQQVETNLAVAQAVRELPAEFRAVVTLRFVADLSYSEIASTLGLPLGTVQSRLSRALERLSRTLGPSLKPEERATP